MTLRIVFTCILLLVDCIPNSFVPFHGLLTDRRERDSAPE